MLHTGLSGTGIGILSMVIDSTRRKVTAPDAGCSTLYVEGLPGSAIEPGIS
jgi:hypothetical protein